MSKELLRPAGVGWFRPIIQILTAEVTCWKVYKLWVQLHSSVAVREV